MPGYAREQTKRVKRSSGWNKVRKQKLKEHPYCACCGRKYTILNKHRLQVHHIHDFSTYPELELVMSNLIVLCGRCHLLIGHLGWWKSINPTVLTDSQVLYYKIQHRRTPSKLKL